MTAAPAASADAGTARPPRLRGVPLLGVGPALRRDPLAVVTRVARESGDIARFRVGPRSVVVVTSPELIREVLVSRADDFRKGAPLLRALRPLLGEGLITSEGDLHDRQRGMIAPYFRPADVKRFVPGIAAAAERTCERWRDGQEIELVHEMHGLTMNLVGELLMGTRIGDERKLAAAITTAFDWEMHALTKPLALPLAVPTPRNLRMRAALRHLRWRIGGVIEERRAAHGDPPDDMLAMLLAARDEHGDPMSRDQVYDETLTLCGAAQESSADAIAWTLYLLAKNPDAYERLRAEVDAALGGRSVGPDDLERLPYALQAFKEGLRMFPPAAIMIRSAVRDSTLAGYRIPAGTVVVVPPWAVHRRPDVHPEPERFDPSRFAPGNEQRIPKYGFLPFGAGRRVCLGSGLALIEGQVLTATFAQHVDLSLLAGHAVEPVLRINLRARNGIRAQVTRRSAGRVPAAR